MPLNVIRVITKKIDARVLVTDVIKFLKEFGEGLPEHCFINDLKDEANSRKNDKVRGWITLNSFEWRGELSGKTYGKLIERVAPKIWGEVKVVLVWSDGTLLGLHIRDSKVSVEGVEVELAHDSLPRVKPGDSLNESSGETLKKINAALGLAECDALSIAKLGNGAAMLSTGPTVNALSSIIIESPLWRTYPDEGRFNDALKVFLAGIRAHVHRTEKVVKRPVPNRPSTVESSSGTSPRDFVKWWDVKSSSEERETLWKNAGLSSRNRFILLTDGPVDPSCLGYRLLLPSERKALWRTWKEQRTAKG